MSDKQHRGFAVVAPDKLEEISRKGGKSIPAEKRSFSQDNELARRAGAKGGKAVKAKDRSFSKDHELARIAGRKGGIARHKKD